MVLLFAMMFSFLGFNGYAAMAATNDTPGLESGEVYYIRNVITGRYLEVQNGADSNGTPVISSEGNRIYAQQWKITRNSNGTYKLQPMSSPTRNVLDITGNNVDIWTDNGASYQQFSIERISTTHDPKINGCYHIKYNGRFLATNGFGTVYLSFLNLGDGTAWSFEKVTKHDADIYSQVILVDWILFVPNYFDTRGA
ncbi:MAG: RICIN domain-containing protein, partial [Clostridiaceae bacterium]|nr:RICIN domain-containing protein [Clostridiaceae bacterium]